MIDEASEAISVIVAGAGLIGLRHIAHVQGHQRTQLVAVIEPSAEITTPEGIPRFTRLDEANVEADAVIIATPTDTHETVGRAAAERGLAMLVEKPVTGSLEQAERLIAAADKANVPLLAGYHRRHHPKIRALKSLLASGRIGDPVGASVIWSVRKPSEYFDTSWRRGVGGSPVFINLVHDLDMLQGLFGEVQDYTGLVAANRDTDAADTGAVALRFASGPLATLLFSDNAPSPWGFEAGTGENPNIASIAEDFLHITCTRGSVAFPSLTVFSGSDNWGDPQVRESTKIDASHHPLDVQLDHLCDVVEGNAKPVVTGEDAMDTLRLALEIQALLGS